MLRAVWDLIVEVGVGIVEGVLRSEYIVIQPQQSICIKELSIQIISDSASVLDLTNHVLDSFPRVRDIERCTLSHVLINIHERGL